jgi:hypothetical protein
MASCANCSNDAFYIYQVNESFGISYCSYHVPRFLQDQKNAGLLKTTAEFNKAQADALASLATVKDDTTSKTSKKKTDTTDDSAPAETPAEAPAGE